MHSFKGFYFFCKDLKALFSSISCSILTVKLTFPQQIDPVLAVRLRLSQVYKHLFTFAIPLSVTQDEYQFCYQAALEYLGSFDHYAT